MNDFESAREMALRSMDFQARTSAEVQRRLERGGYEENVVDEVVADLERAGLLDDSRFSADWVESRARRKGLGRIRLAAELRRKGVAKGEVEEALGEISPESEIEAALNLVRKRATPESLANRDEKRRIAAFLQRRGYNWETIEQVFVRILANTE